MSRILIVDDCKDGAGTLALLARLWGHEAQVAYDGHAALRIAELFRPQVFLLDIGMPELDGYELARQLRGRAEFRDALLVAVSGYGEPAYRLRGEEVGFDQYLLKPLDLDALQELLRRRDGQATAGDGRECEVSAEQGHS